MDTLAAFRTVVLYTLTPTVRTAFTANERGTLAAPRVGPGHMKLVLWGYALEFLGLKGAHGVPYRLSWRPTGANAPWVCGMQRKRRRH